ncbi:DUF1566 domain-containing protein [Polaribacter sp.]|nr:DUF1566 domain-containing protein [Polaribacter sp.]
MGIGTTDPNGSAALDITSTTKGLLIPRMTALQRDAISPAATVCNEYSVTVDGVTYGDWYLPSKHELNLLYIERAAVGGFTTNYYWSSTENDNNLAWEQDFLDDGYQTDSNKGGTFSVRAVRAF